MAGATANERRTRLRQILAGDTCVLPASVFDPLSARAARELGFEAAMLGGSVASLAVLGAPDWALITLSELADLVSRITRASDVPLIVDADHGYGNALNVMRTVEELERAGAAGLTIEDTRLPAAYGSSRALELIPLEEAVGKLRAAVEARSDPELVLLGRTPGPGLSDLDGCLARVRAFQETGVDALVLVGLGGMEPLETVAKECRLPLMIGGLGAPIERERLARLGVRLALQGHLPIQAAARAAYHALAALRDGAAPEDLRDLGASSERMATLTNEEQWERWKREWLGS